MKLVRVRIENFRSIRSEEFAFPESNMLVLVGANNAGKSNIIRAIDAVSERLGNTRTVCRKYYIHPALVDGYLMGLTVPQPPALSKKAKRSQPGAALRRDEVLVLQFLQEKV